MTELETRTRDVSQSRNGCRKDVVQRGKDHWVRNDRRVHRGGKRGHRGGYNGW